MEKNTNASEQTVWESDANQGRESKITPVDFSTEYCGHAGLPGPDYVGPIILAGTDGNDYSVLNKVDPRVKVIATSGQPPTEEDAKLAQALSFGISFVEDRKTHYIQDANEETLEEAYGDGVKLLGPENKHWILRTMGFKGRGKGKWKHILFEEEIEFDLQTDSLVQLAFQIHKTGYKNAHTEWASQQKTASA